MFDILHCPSCDRKVKLWKPGSTCNGRTLSLCWQEMSYTLKHSKEHVLVFFVVVVGFVRIIYFIYLFIRLFSGVGVGIMFSLGVEAAQNKGEAGQV